MAGYGFLVGLASSLMGVSGGSLVTMVLTLYGKPIHNAVATSAGVGVPITLAGTLGYVLAGLPHQSVLPTLSIGFVSVIEVLRDLDQRRLTTAAAAQLLGLERREVFRLLKGPTAPRVRLV
jgi:hypothetical protein